MRLNRLKFRQIRKELGVTHKEIAQAINMSESAVSAWENGRRNCKPRELHQLAEVLKVGLAAISDHEGPLYASAKEYDGAATVNEVKEVYKVSKVPVLSFAQAAGFDPILEPFAEYLRSCSDEEAIFTEVKDNFFAIRVEGDSMTPEYPDGTVLLVAGGEYPQRGDTVVAKIRETGQVVVKNYSRKDNLVRLESVNPEGKTFSWNCKENPGYLQWMWPVVKAEIDLRKRRWEQQRL